MHYLIEPLTHPFMQTALLASLLIANTCAVLGVYVVLRRMAFIGDAVAHTTLPGLVIAYLNRWNILLGGVVAAVVTAISIGWLSRRRELREDTAIGIMFTGMFALGVVLMSAAGSYRDFSHMLFGNILGVSGGDLIGIAVVAVTVALVLGLLHKELVLSSVDPSHARSIGLSADRLRYVLLVLLALAVVTGIQAVGVILTSALLITPAATAAMLTRRLTTMMLVSALDACVSCIVGLYLSFYFDVSTGGTIVLVCTAIFVLVFGGKSISTRRVSSDEATA